MAKLWRKPFDSETRACTPGEVLIEQDQCKGCGYCIQFCPRQVLVVGQKINSKGYTSAEVSPEKICLGCGLCQIICPEFAIKVKCPAPAQ